MSQSLSSLEKDVGRRILVGQLQADALVTVSLVEPLPTEMSDRWVVPSGRSWQEHQQRCKDALTPAYQNGIFYISDSNAFRTYFPNSKKFSITTYTTKEHFGGTLNMDMLSVKSIMINITLAPLEDPATQKQHTIDQAGAYIAAMRNLPELGMSFVKGLEAVIFVLSPESLTRRKDSEISDHIARMVSAIASYINGQTGGDTKFSLATEYYPVDDARKFVASSLPASTKSLHVEQLEIKPTRFRLVSS